jgi:hypothetical protein
MRIATLLIFAMMLAGVVTVIPTASAAQGECYYFGQSNCDITNPDGSISHCHYYFSALNECML